MYRNIKEHFTCKEAYNLSIETLSMSDEKRCLKSPLMWVFFILEIFNCWQVFTEGNPL